ncbi:ATP binding protein, putative [Ricinus communis]|uniref:ATP binding protein, putative n=2 Tax=Ricinus communis TaxID=3988 RepID=B9SG16_RICCO|nr:ATP binding protein, putative [Ricinus communis]|eukprot:XP_025014167.1 probable receptor-like protein kinase At5g24010 [Ricinus communis]
MERLQPLILFLINFIQLCSLVSPSSGYTLPDKYFLNCGSESEASLEPERSFVGDLPYLVGPSKAVKDSSLSASSSLYQTARVFQKESPSYQFQIDKQGTYIIRLHFFVFPSPDANLADALFTVQAAGFRLLFDFSISDRNSPVIKEFLFTINIGKFFIDFIPSRKTSLAFVNAIEVFAAPESFIPDDTTHVTTAGSNGNYNKLLSQALHSIHRINVGGSIITATNDSLWRNWMPDDQFLSDPETAKDCSPYEGILMRTRTSVFIAPDHVYKTAKELKQSNISMITWSFKTRKNSRHLVRVHFCDITGASLGMLKFSFHIYKELSKNISQYDIIPQNAAPFYFDFVVDTDNSGMINITVHQNNDSAIKNAFLNGLEIMEIMEKSVSILVQHKTKKKSWPLAVGSLAAGLLLLIGMLGLLMILKSRRGKANRTSGRQLSVHLYGGSSHNWSAERNANMFLAPDLNLALKTPYIEIQQATKSFSSKLLIGEGGFGKVYKGTFRGGVKVAVKRSEPGHGQGILEFQTEIMVLSQIRHRHLVSLIGYCAERSEMILVYEFMEKGTLRDHLYMSDSNSQKYTSRSELSWEQRLKICIDSAKGLHYLHTGLARRIIHRDVKSTNILLNEDYIAKVADFGLSKSGAVDPDENTGVKGSFGYLDPEYLMTLQLTEKSDVYSFGVVLLEVLCARPAIITSDQEQEVNLAEWGLLWQKKRQLDRIIDPFLMGTINSDSLRKFGETAEKCLRTNSSERPMMNDVLYDLEYALRLQQTSMHRELVEDSMNNAPLEMPLQALHRLPSRKGPGEDDGSYSGGDDATFSMANSVYSQMRIDGGR